MEAVAVLVVGVLGLVVLVAPLLAIAALVRLNRLETRVSELTVRIQRLQSRRSAPPVAQPPAPEPTAPAAPPATASTPPRSEPPPAPEPTSSPEPPPVVEPQPERPRARRPQATPDFATTLGPRILVGAGGLAVIVFLALFVRYAWENDWVGPAGRVLSGSVVSLGLVAAGLRLLNQRYRPLGQGLAAAGFAGLYVSAYAAHGVYDLVPRGLAGAVMVAVIVSAVLVADRRRTRLLAALAWIGGYLTPALLSTGRDRAESLFVYLGLLGAGAVWLDRRKGWLETTPLALLGTVTLYLGWCGAHYDADRFVVAAVGLVGLSALFALGIATKESGSVFDTLLLSAVLVVSGLVSAGLASAADRPLALLALLLAQLTLAVLVRRRWEWSEAATVATLALAVLVWFVESYEAHRGAEALTLALGLAGAAVLVVAVRGFILGQQLTAPDGTTQLSAAALAWVALERVLNLSHPDLLGPAALALAVLFLALGLAARRQEVDQTLWARVSLGLAAAFLTLAIPVQLGLFGITLAWALEALVLLWLGSKQDSVLTRLGGYAVLLLAVGRLFTHHLPLHATIFTPVFNPVFATWLFVVLAAAAARLLTRSPREERSPLDVLSGPLLATLSLGLLFGLLTGEIDSFFDHKARMAREIFDDRAALVAERQGGLAVSVLWTVFATGLLSAGLGLRSRSLFYAAYGLFGITAMKVVFVDLATLSTLYRMLSFLALGVLLLAGAWLNLRFRERLAPPGGDG